jgi:dolichol-phosphate mannosyltransferase
MTPAPDYMVSVLVVVGDDAAVLPEFLAEVHAMLRQHYRYYELLLVDNQSSPHTAEVVREHIQRLPGLRWLRLSRRHTEEIAWAAGFDHCIGDYVVLMDLYTDAPAMVPVLVEAAARENAVAVAAPPNAQTTSLRRVVRRLFLGVANRLLESPIDGKESYFLAFPRQTVNALTRIKNRRRYLRYLNALVGFRQVTVPNVAFQRGNGRPPRGWVESVGKAGDLLISNSLVPLRAAARLGLLVSFINFLYLGYILVVAIVREHLAEGWFTQSIMTTSMFLCLFLVLAVLAEYVGRILEETQERPLYFLELEMDSQASRRRAEDLLNVA